MWVSGGQYLQGCNSFVSGMHCHLRQNCEERAVLTRRSNSRTLGNLKSWLGDAAGFSTFDFRIVFQPPLTNSMSSLPSRLSLIRPKPNEACSIQSCAFQFFKFCFRRAACSISMNANTLYRCSPTLARVIGADLRVRTSPLTHARPPRTIRRSI
jgi:hypothetical protein